MMGGSALAQHYLSAYSVGQEERADAAALGFLDKSHQSARGLLDFFRILDKEELLSASRQDPYLQTHPLTRERIEAVSGHVDDVALVRRQGTMRRSTGCTNGCARS